MVNEDGGPEMILMACDTITATGAPSAHPAPPSTLVSQAKFNRVGQGRDRIVRGPLKAELGFGLANQRSGLGGPVSPPPART